jgi:hypothetical protein
MGILYLLIPLCGGQSSSCCGSEAQGGIHVSWPVCTSCNIWIVQEAIQLMLKAKTTQELIRNFLKGNIL